MGDGFRRVGYAVALALLALALLAPGGAVAAKKKTSCSSGGIFEGLGESKLPDELEGSLEAPVLAQYGIFRRAQTSSDLLPPINPAAEAIGRRLSGYYPSEIRQIAALPNGARYYLVPGLPHVPKVGRPECVPKEVLKLIEKERAKATEPDYCVVATGVGSPLASSECNSFGEVATENQVFGLFGEGPAALLLPDGVASVRIVGPGSRTETIAASEDAYVYTPPATLEKEEEALFRKLFKPPTSKHSTKAQQRRTAQRALRVFAEIVARTRPSRIEWLGPTGLLVKTIKRPADVGSSLVTSIAVAILTAG